MLSESLTGIARGLRVAPVQAARSGKVRLQVRCAPFRCAALSRGRGFVLFFFFFLGGGEKKRSQASDSCYRCFCREIEATHLSQMRKHGGLDNLAPLCYDDFPAARPAPLLPSLPPPSCPGSGSRMQSITAAAANQSRAEPHNGLRRTAAISNTIKPETAISLLPI